MSGPGVGFEYPRQKVSWLQRDLLLFANSIGAKADELHLLYELHPKFAAFPTYPIILCKLHRAEQYTIRSLIKPPPPIAFKGDTQEVIDFYAANKATRIPDVPEFDYRRVVDGQRKIEFIKPLPTTSKGRNFEIRTKVVGVYDKGKPGTVLDVETELIDTDSNDVYTRPATVNVPAAKGHQTRRGP
ncbi:hypothetical protein NQ176_g9911 [Zarea fungicola]|uniref:Uncharacterized protein n=1 Tax=Zarea fungicola TaxID=93591 RepID=A0ACC1MKT1_9HYPO|nr:hypothetical protein NQ176_g9911 [Lecanicillium fungicola]